MGHQLGAFAWGSHVGQVFLKDLDVESGCESIMGREWRFSWHANGGWPSF